MNGVLIKGGVLISGVSLYTGFQVQHIIMLAGNIAYYHVQSHVVGICVVQHKAQVPRSGRECTTVVDNHDGMHTEAYYLVKSIQVGYPYNKPHTMYQEVPRYYAEPSQ